MERPASTSQPKHTNIGVVGLGIIGRRIAAHLRRKGFAVYVWNRSPRPIPNFVGSLRELTELCNYIQIFVSDDNALLQTAEQLSEKLTPRHVVLAHSTVAPDSMRAAAEALKVRNYFSYLDRDLIDDHAPLNAIGVATIDVIDFDYPSWHTAGDTMDKISAQSLQIVGSVALYYLSEFALK